MAERKGFGHGYFSAEKFLDPVSAPVAPPTFEPVFSKNLSTNKLIANFLAGHSGLEPLPIFVSLCELITILTVSGVKS